MSSIIGYIIICIGLIFIMISIICYSCQVKTSHEFRIDFHKEYCIQNLRSPKIIEVEVMKNSILLTGIVIALIGYIVTLLLFDISILLKFNFKITVWLILPIIIGLIMCIFLISKYFIKIYIFPEKLLIKNLISERIIYFSELDHLEFVQQYRDSYFFNSYIFKKGDATILKLKTGNFKNLQIIEDVFCTKGFNH